MRSTVNNHQPLAELTRPASFSQFLGHDYIFEQNRPLRKIVENQSLRSIILWGPPGTGKTTLARLIGLYHQEQLVELSAVTHGVKDIRQEISRSEIRINHQNKGLILFIDEVHRLNKGQQDVLLPALEKGLVRFIGATTENPSFEVNSAILSRCLVFKLEPISITSLEIILKNALKHQNSPYKQRLVSDECIRLIARAASGDARSALNLLEAALESSSHQKELEEKDLQSLMGSILRKYDKKADTHYDLTSALIKSIRASHPDASLYYLARLIEAGEDPLFIARRLMIAASEDVGNANPTALLVATNGAQSVQMIGYPEARIILAQVTTYLAASPKSNRSYLGLEEAIKTVNDTGDLPIPMHLRNAPSRLMKEFGYGEGYINAHERPHEAFAQNYLPEKIKGKCFYKPSDIGTEKSLKQNLELLAAAFKKKTT